MSCGIGYTELELTYNSRCEEKKKQFIVTRQFYVFRFHQRRQVSEGIWSRGLCSSSVLGSVDWQFVDDVLGQLIGPIFKSQSVPLTIGPIECPETSVIHCQPLPEERVPQPHHGRSLKSRRVW